MNEEEIYQECLEAENTISNLKNSCKTLLNIAEILRDTIKNNNTIFLCGNGGSAADSQHIAAEFVGRFLKERESWPAVSLTTNTSILTAIGNDYSYDKVFSRQVRGLMKPKDTLVCISTSGESKNIINAAIEAKEIGSKVISFTGQRKSSLFKISDICFMAPSNQTPRIQESHIISLHIICKIVEKNLLTTL
jgi:D-sedoheptulose 7-phosphate isomerase